MAAAKEKRGHWTLPYPSKPEKSHLAFAEGLGQKGRGWGMQLHTSYHSFLPAALPQLDDHTAALGKDEFCAH